MSGSQRDSMVDLCLLRASSKLEAARVTTSLVKKDAFGSVWAVQKWVTYSTSQYTNIDILCWTLTHHGSCGLRSAILCRSEFVWSRTYDTWACCDETILDRRLEDHQQQEKLGPCGLFVSSFVTMARPFRSCHITLRCQDPVLVGRQSPSHCHGWVAVRDPGPFVWWKR